MNTGCQSVDSGVGSLSDEGKVENKIIISPRVLNLPPYLVFAAVCVLKACQEPKFLIHLLFIS